jgi:hypothetical protein
MTAPGRCLADRGGMASVEFAILAPIALLLVTLGYAGVSLHAGAVSLEMGAAAAARWAVLGEAPADPGDCRVTPDTRPAMIRCAVERHVCPPGGGFCYWDAGWRVTGDDGVISPLRVEMRSFADARNVGRSEPYTDRNGNGVYDSGDLYVDVNENGRWDAQTWTATLGGSGEHVVFTLTMAQRVAHPLLVPVLGERLIHEARVVVRNEPW